MPTIDTTKFAELLEALEGTDNQKRQQAEALYQQAKKAEPEDLVANLLAVVASENLGISCRLHGAVLLRQLVSPSDDQNKYAFSRVSPALRHEIASEVLRRFEAESNSTLQKAVGDIITQLVGGAWNSDNNSGWVSLDKPGWPAFLERIVQMANPASTSSEASCAAALGVLKELVPQLSSEIVAAHQSIGGILQNALSHTSAKIRCAGVVLICEMVTVFDKSDWTPLVSTAGAMLQVMQGFAQHSCKDELDSCMQAYNVVVDVEPDFFKAQLSSTMQPGQLFAELAKAHEGVDDGVRQLAVEWLVTYAEKRPKWLAKNLPGFGQIVVDCCMALMLEVSGEQSDLNDWVARMDDEEGEEDADELYKVGEECIDRFVEAVGLDCAKAFLFESVSKFAAQDAWQAKLAAIAAVKQTVEYVEEPDQVSDMTKLLLAHVDHTHPRVRYISLHALGQLAHDQAPSFQEAWHKAVMPVFLKKMDDPVDRVASMAMSSFVCFAEGLDNTFMLGYSQEYMQKLVQKLQSSSHRMVQEECITSIAIIAGVIEQDFSQYYDGIMPLLKTFVMTATAENQHRLRGKAFECLSHLGMAVGKTKFLPDAQEAVAQMFKTTQELEADDVQREYIQEASQRICKCLKSDFAQFVPHLLPNLLKSLNLGELGEDAGSAVKNDDDEDDEHVTVRTGDGKLVKVHSSKFQELSQSLQILQCFCEEMEGAFYDCLPQVAGSLLHIVSAKDEETMLCDDARGLAFQTWAMLIKCARVGGEERGLGKALANELLRTALKQIIELIQQEDDAEIRDSVASSLSDCLRNAGHGLLAGAEVLQLVRQMFQFLDESVQRSNQVEQKTKENAEQRDDDEESNPAQDEKLLRSSLQEALGATMETHAGEFLQCLPECSQHISAWLSVNQNKPLAFFLACDMVKHLKEQSQPVWPLFMAPALESLLDKDVELRIPATYLVNLAAPLPDFGEAAPEAFKRLANTVRGPVPKKRDERQKIAFENAIAALLMLARHQGSHCPPDVPAWQLVVSRLPLKEDHDEAKRVHEAVVDLVMEQHAGILGADRANLGKILSCLAEVYRQEDLCTKATDEKIHRVFQMLPRDMVANMAGQFTEKQQKKIEKMLLSSGG